MSNESVFLVLVFLFAVGGTSGDLFPGGVNTATVETSRGPTTGDIDSDIFPPTVDYSDYLWDRNEALDTEVADPRVELSVSQLQKNSEFSDIYLNNDMFYDELASYFSDVDSGEEMVLKGEQLDYPEEGLSPFLGGDITPSESYNDGELTYLKRLLEVWKGIGSENGPQDQIGLRKEIVTNPEEELRVVIVARETIILLPGDLEEASKAGRKVLPRVFLRPDFTENEAEEFGFHWKLGLLVGPFLMGLGMLLLFLLCRTKTKEIRKGRRSRNKNKEDTEPILTTV